MEADGSDEDRGDSDISEHDESSEDDSSEEEEVSDDSDEDRGDIILHDVFSEDDSSEEEEVSVVTTLLQNNPSVTEIAIRLFRHEASPGAVAAALEQNPFVTSVAIIILDADSNTDWQPLVRVLAMRANLLRIYVLGERRRRDNNAICRPFLQAIRQKSNLQHVTLSEVEVAGHDIISLLDNATNMTELLLASCTFVEEGGQGARQVADALQRNRSIEKLSLLAMENSQLVLLLQGVLSHRTVRFLDVGTSSPHDPLFSEPVALSIQQLLVGTSGLQKFTLIASGVTNPANHTITPQIFGPIAQGLIDSGSVTKIAFRGCHFSGAATKQFNRLLQTKLNLHSLAVMWCGFDGTARLGFTPICSGLIAALPRPNSSLRCLEIHPFFDVTGRMGHLGDFFRAVEKSQLEHLLIGTISSQQQLQDLASSIPAMKLKKLEVGVFFSEAHVRYSYAAEKQQLLHGIKKNISLHSVEGRFYYDYKRFHPFNEDEKRKLESYAERNARLVEWIDNPSKVTRCVWDRALGKANEVSPDVFFKAMKSIAPVIGSGRLKRKARGRIDIHRDITDLQLYFIKNLLLAHLFVYLPLFPRTVSTACCYCTYPSDERL